MSKYHNKQTTIDGIVFQSIAESHRYLQLKILQRGKQIQNLRVHPRYPLDINGVRVCTYIADFDYDDEQANRVIEDVKGVKTQAYVIKRKLVAALYGIQITEIEA